MSTKAIELRNAIRDRLLLLKKFKAVRTQPKPILQEENLPCATVFILSEQKADDGDFNAGFPHFETQITIGISVVFGGGSVDALDVDIDQQIALIEETLLCDPTFVKLIDNELFEGIPQIITRRLFPEEGSLYLTESRMEIVFKTRSDFYPKKILDDTVSNMKLHINPI